MSIQIASVDTMNNGDTSRSGEICAFVEIQRYETFEMPANNPDPITNGFGGRSGCPDVTSTRALSVLLHQLNRDETQLAQARYRSFARANELTAQRMMDGYGALYEALLASRTTVPSQADVQAGMAAHAA